MRGVFIRVRKFAIFCHRWMGLAFCVLFAWWFASGIFMMYWDFPTVSQADQLDRSEPIDLSKIKLSPEEAFAKLGRDGAPGGVQLAMFDGRPVYRFAMGGGRGGGGRDGAVGGGGGAGDGAPATSVVRGRGSAAGSGRGDGSFGGGHRGRRGGPGGVTEGSTPLTRGGNAGAGAGAPVAPGGGRRGGSAAGQAMVYADDGSVQDEYSKDLLLRVASRWTGQPASSAKVDEVTATDQWTVQSGLRNLRPLWKYTFPDREQVYVNGKSGEVVQYTTLGSRIGAHLGPIPHWLYYTPLRVQQKLWTNVVIWSSGIGTVMALMGLMVGISLYSPSKRYRYEGAPTMIPYTGQKRLHMILGLFFGILTCTWAFSGMLSMGPFPVPTNRGSGGTRAGQEAGGRGASPTGRIQAALRSDHFQMSDYADKSPLEALAQMGSLRVKQLDFTSFDEKPIYMAALDSRETRISPFVEKPARSSTRTESLKWLPTRLSR